MSQSPVGKSAVMDRLDEQIARSVQLSPRLPFRAMAEVLGVAEQTVARRYRRLRRDGLIRVTLGLDPRALGVTVWSIRVRCRPEHADALAEVLARRDDVSWVSIHSGGWEIAFNLRAVREADTEDLLTRILPKVAPVSNVAPYAILHTFVGGASTDWEGWRDALTREQVAALRTHAGDPVIAGGETAELRPTDRPLLEALSRDGRTSYATLARATGSTAGRVTRRVEALVRSGLAYFDVDIAPAATGHYHWTTLWMTVEPRYLQEVGHILAGHPDIPFAAAVTGPANLTANLTTVSLDAVYRFVTTTLAQAPGITGYELVPLTRRTKYAGAQIVGDRLAPPSATARRRR
ncbi:Lrp/AsnC family transcriptional regulator [Nocardia testacea]|uniref:Lrp/AsnC family transcriptional regulator n=1 Tax=Nocardia testacea TaxID=248551 RepID=UPI003C2E29F3